MTGAEVPSGKRANAPSPTRLASKKARTSRGSIERKITDFVTVLSGGAAASTSASLSFSATTTDANTNTASGSTSKPTKGMAVATKAELGLDTFSPTAYLASLPSVGPSPTTRELLSLECATLDPSWLALLKDEITKDYFLDLKRFLWNEGVQGSESTTNKVFPPARDIYSWSRHCPLDKVKVVVIGQDPYHNDGQAHGLAFSVRPGVAVPPSLRNMYKELSNKYPDFVAPKTGDLTPWARSGVLLLNTSLTVRARQAGSHSGKGWELFTDKVIDLVDRFGGSDGAGKLGKGVVFFAWGAWAAKRVAKLDTAKHLVLKSAHPSPLSAHRGFLNNGHFKQANEWIEKKYGPDGIIDWSSICPK
ncbi:BQ2448_7726 [Microbotryum intermedium]|uniref:Uracil-DNA glycosylase n=1 Tax=Microbotryum intermedium TaxID=269621 RepID=A0A238FN32_9BASI|nr:BQ2448_7726 [Microbotryum intermedium]